MFRFYKAITAITLVEVVIQSLNRNRLGPIMFRFYKAITAITLVEVSTSKQPYLKLKYVVTIKEKTGGFRIEF